MPQNRNPWVAELLSWHGHDRGGVRVPFSGSNPLRSTIETGLILRLRTLAHSIASGDSAAPRWIFLIGGPGNGKSETVEDFLRVLDGELGMGGDLVRFLESEFNPHPLLKRRVVVEASDVATAPGAFTSRVGRLMVIQDATATDDALGDAARQLVNDVADLLTSREDSLPVFLACTNRGLLARALKDAYNSWGSSSPVTELLASLIKASSLGVDALSNHRPSCWPLQANRKVACWPLDLESLLVAPGTTPAPAERIFSVATEVNNWEVSNSCADCDSNNVCPYRQNASWLRNAPNLVSLTRFLRRGELATGQRWNFRTTFSLAAELIVGQWGDFEGADFPCDWVHAQAAQLSSPIPEAKVRAASSLLARLYPHALFPDSLLKPTLRAHSEQANTWLNQETSRAIVETLSLDETGSSKPIRDLLSSDYGRLDPASYTPTDPDHDLRKIENDYSQSVELGNDTVRRAGFAAVEDIMLGLMERAEAEWDMLGRDMAKASRVVHLLRRIASVIVKRTVGIRLGYHSYQEYLEDYEAALRDRARLNRVVEVLQPLLGRNGFRFNMVESFGQPRTEGDESRQVVLASNRVGLRTFPAPEGTSDVPPHDLPYLEIGNIRYTIPLTFDFYLALRLRSEGCESSSLPASVRAAIDRVRHLHAGQLCRQKELFVDGTTRIDVMGKRIILSDEGAEPSLSTT